MKFIITPTLLVIGLFAVSGCFSIVNAQPSGYEFKEPVLPTAKYVTIPNGQTKSIFEYAYKVGEVVGIYDYDNLEWVAVKVIERKRNGIYNSYKTSPSFKAAYNNETSATTGECDWISENSLSGIRKVK